jgi:outer membrane protein OmpA-like peptidoglycan-associated protein
MKRTLTTLRKIALFCLISVGLNAQQINSLYFLDNSPLRHTYNPSFQPVSNFYFGIPALNNIKFGFESDLPTYKNAGFDLGHVFNMENDQTKLLSAIRPFSSFESNLQLTLLDMGFRYNSNYWTFTVTEKAELNSVLPYSVFDILLNGFELVDGFAANMTGLNFDINTYTETALGYSRAVNNRFGFGAKLKLLYGNNYFSVLADQTNINVNNESVNAVADIAVIKSSAYELNDQFGLINPVNFFNYLKPQGLGGAIDLGVNYKPLKFIELAFSVSDLGIMRWNQVKSIDYRMNYSFDENDAIAWRADHPEFTGDIPQDSIIAELKKSITTTRSDISPIENYLSPKMNVSAEFGLLKNKLSLGLLSRSMFRDQQLIHELTTAFNVRPGDWLNLGFSYSITNGNMSNIGFGGSIRAGKLNIFLTADYIPIKYVSMDLQQFSPVIPAVNFPLGYDKNRMNFGLGFNLVFGSRKDADKDRISDKFDKCPDTLIGVKVDRHGCPVDTDKDGVPDYLDICPATPKEARGYVGPDGCPLDSDGDEVPDYLDKCPGTLGASRIHVNEQGCPIDTDGDRVLDYIDRCPDTPVGIAVDSVGCPLDTDGDGVPDYLDLCVETPFAAKGFVDKNGCPVDTDDDGVLDYLDLCPDTPVEARGFVDMNGCLIDADDDGVADYMDECRDTPFAARGLVDHRGCPLDSDFDGIPDYLDDCPRVAGMSEFRGCPEIKMEVRMLIQKAAQTIQFKKDSIKMEDASFGVLNEIVTVLSQNSSYLLRIQGHTDNVIRAYHPSSDTLTIPPLHSLAVDSVKTETLNISEASTINQEVVLKADVQKNDSISKVLISEAYARLVKQYFISKGIDEKRLFIKGFGDAKPVATNETEAGRSKNRRVELLVVFEEEK